MFNLIGGEHRLTDTMWAVSLIRSQIDAPQHAYLIIEGLSSEGTYTAYEAHLVFAQGTQAEKASVSFGEISLFKLKEIAENCHAYTWQMVKDPEIKLEDLELIKLIKQEDERAKAGEITYLLTGKTYWTGSVGGSSRAVGSRSVDEQVRKWCKDVNWKASGQPGYISRESIRSLMQTGHNCYSWAKAMLIAIHLKAPLNWRKVIILGAVANPYEVHGVHNGDVKKSKCFLQ